MRSSVFPDVNVWLALAYDKHRHFHSALTWFESAQDSLIYFCRLTQLSFLRILCNSHVMGDAVQTPSSAWRIYDRWFREDSRIGFLDEPAGLEREFRLLTQSANHRTASEWADAYLVAFAQMIGATLVTFDRRMAERAGPDSLLLG